jgi:hypothetical protein
MTNFEFPIKDQTQEMANTETPRFAQRFVRA